MSRCVDVSNLFYQFIELGILRYFQGNFFFFFNFNLFLNNKISDFFYEKSVF